MTKEQLISKIAKNSNLTRDQVKIALKSLTETVSEELARGEKVMLSDLGSFVLSKRKSRVGVNVKTGQKTQFPPTVVPRFRASQKLKAKIR